VINSATALTAVMLIRIGIIWRLTGGRRERTEKRRGCEWGSHADKTPLSECAQ
jgi:hypothetical protein